MCGRYTLLKKPTGIRISDEIEFQIDWERGVRDMSARFNISPTQKNVVLKADGSPNRLSGSLMKWGLVPSWSKADRMPSLLINARSESIAEKPTFRAAFQRRRCLVPANGFFEWKRNRNVSQAYYFQLENEALFHMAGIWESWLDKAGKPQDTYAIITTAPNALMRKFHERMPAILEGERIQEWLEGGAFLNDSEERYRFFAPIDAKRMKCHPVDALVNNNRSEGPQCIAEVTPIENTQLNLDI